MKLPRRVILERNSPENVAESHSEEVECERLPCVFWKVFWDALMEALYSLPRTWLNCFFIILYSHCKLSI